MSWLKVSTILMQSTKWSAVISSSQDVAASFYLRSSDVAYNILEQYVYHALSLAGISIVPDNLQACQRTKKRGCIMVKFDLWKAEN